ncbi:hypothetical protein GOP47_0011176 [Adiantum capillus-veneris]|uniref:Uncharacterized protein n=1 Tax=Adiantum capillus-veneris TaxID=13818 RepID=A0A9D4ZF57_ADICA|nr:hypothetical protein GOP47_0011176 [Adiantum capillus-veneris]
MMICQGRGLSNTKLWLGWTCGCCSCPDFSACGCGHRQYLVRKLLPIPPMAAGWSSRRAIAPSLRSGVAAYGDGVAGQLGAELLQDEDEVFAVLLAEAVALEAVVDAIVAEILPVDGDAVEDGILGQHSGERLDEGGAAVGGGEGVGGVLGEGPAAKGQHEVELLVLDLEQLPELAEDAQVLGGRAERVLRLHAVADEFVLDGGPVVVEGQLAGGLQHVDEGVGDVHQVVDGRILDKALAVVD